MITIIVFRSRSDNSSDSESRDSQGQSDTDSDMDDSVFKDDSPTDKDHQPIRIDHSKLNGYGHMTNGHSEHNGEHNHNMLSNGKKEHEQLSKMSSKNREIFEKLFKLVKQPGIKDFVFGQSLSDLELNEDNMEEIIARCRQLQVETIRFTRWRQMDMLEDFIKSQNGSFETK